MLMLHRSHCLALATALALATIPTIAAAETANLVATCAFDTGKGKPNPLGLRAYITAVEVNGDTTFTYEQFPSTVSGTSGTSATIAQQRKLTFYKTSIPQARQLLLEQPAYYEALIGFKDEAGFQPINDVLSCQGVSQGRPNDAANQPIQQSPKVADLPDGTYRFWNGDTRTGDISDAELLRQGGILAVFNKTDDQVIGSISRIDAEAGVCFEGNVGGNTISGFATTYQPLQQFNQSDNFEPLGIIPDGSLKVRRGQQISNDRVRFPSALLNLNDYSKINLGNSQAPTRCPR